MRVSEMLKPVKLMMRDALDNALSNGKDGFTSQNVKDIKAALDGMVLVGI